MTPDTQIEEIMLASLDDAWASTTLKYFGQKNRAVLLNGELSDDNAVGLSSQLLALDSESPEPIKLFINTPGGSMTNGLLIIDTLTSLRSAVIGIGFGLIASMGFVIMQSCKYRLSFPNATYFYHEPIQVVQVSSAHEIQSTTGFYDHQLKIMNEIILKRCGKKAFNKKLHKSTSSYLTADEMVDLNLLDAIIRPQKKGLRWPHAAKVLEQKDISLNALLQMSSPN